MYILKEFVDHGYDLEKLKSYEIFLTQCQLKNYDGYNTMMHHILPKKFMRGSDLRCNLIRLSYEDHYNAHLILGYCFPIGDERRKKNICSANMIINHISKILRSKNVIVNSKEYDFWERSNVEIKELITGENHCFYGKHHSDVTKIKISNSLKKKYNSGELVSPMKGKTHSSDTLKKISVNVKGKTIGCKNGRASKTLHVESGIVFDTRRQACEYFKISSVTLTKRIRLGIFSDLSNRELGNIDDKLHNTMKNKQIVLDGGFVDHRYNSKSHCVSITNVQTGMVFDGIQIAANYYGVCRVTIRKQIKAGVFIKNV